MDTKKHIDRSTAVMKRFKLKTIDSFEETYGKPQPLIGYCSSSHTLKFQLDGDDTFYYGTIANIKPIRVENVTSGEEVLIDYSITFCPMWTEEGPEFTPATIKLSDIQYKPEVEYVTFKESDGKKRMGIDDQVYTFQFKGKVFTFFAKDFVKLLYTTENNAKRSVFGYITDISVDGIISISAVNVYRGQFSIQQMELKEEDLIGVFRFTIAFSPFIFKDKRMLGPIPEEISEEVEEEQEQEDPDHATENEEFTPIEEEDEDDSSI